MRLFSKILSVGIVTEPLKNEGDGLEVARQVAEKTQRLLGRAVGIREVDAGT